MERADASPTQTPPPELAGEQQGALLAQGVTQLSPVPLPEPGRGEAGERLGQGQGLQGKLAMLKEAKEAVEGRWLALQAGWCQAQHQLLNSCERRRRDEGMEPNPLQSNQQSRSPNGINGMSQLVPRGTGGHHKAGTDPGHPPCRHHNLEEQVNAMIQLNVAEVGMLHHNVACVEERTAYSTHERARNEVLDAFHTRLSQLEAQQQAAQLEEQDRSGATLCHLHRQLMNLAVALATILLVCVSACSLPLLRSRRRALSSLSVLALLSVAWHCWDHLRWLPWEPGTAATQHRLLSQLVPLTWRPPSP
ncbi:hypothetical protein KIL84_009530 [Mauremys mutica]|uniref:Testis-specific protein TEX28 n=1 Tax=Mauremys mutica TaxID=74926 RepID=A0A9D4BBT3_9SAUR|nr:hypothetical protein KIL84_009530 [Mauremys mutica]